MTLMNGIDMEEDMMDLCVTAQAGFIETLLQRNGDLGRSYCE